MFKFIEDAAIHLGVTTRDLIARADLDHHGYQSPTRINAAWDDLHIRGTVPDWVSYYASRVLNRPVPRKEIVF